MREGACWQVDTLTREIALNVRGPEGKSRARGHEGMRAGEWQCKGANAAEPRAKVQRWDRKKHNSRGAPWGNRSATEGRAGARGQGDMGTRGRYEGMRAGGHEGWMGQAPGSGC